jgi:NAD(P)H-dependent flavin oxidoreductase YrpB (nitropropane dioxygenase family)
MAAVLAAGAAGVRVGTRFLAVEEAEAHPEYLQALMAAEAQDTIYTDAFSVGWPDAPHRVLRSSLEAAKAFEGEVVGTLTDTWDGLPYQIAHFGCVAIHKSATGTVAAMSQWAGEGVGSVKRMQTASEIIHELTGEAEMLLKKWS